MSATEPLVHRVWIDAPPERVFPFFCEPERLTRWLGDAAELDAAPGGRFAVDFGQVLVRGRYLEVQPPERVVFTWGQAGSEQLPPGSSRVEVALAAERGGTTVTLRHHDLPGAERDSHDRGWLAKLAQLAEHAAGR
ncbi:MAG TPA: SRPBCC domain-containing protein [Baekduia sp.]|nr:SRPBCC domain-containing protein [Baekduia sp.]